MTPTAARLYARRSEYGRIGDDDDFSDFVDGVGREVLERYCTPYLSFDESRQEGFGFWPDLKLLEEDARTRNRVIKVNAGDPWPALDDDIECVMEVTDHGNVTLYQASRRPWWRRHEFWSCV